MRTTHVSVLCTLLGCLLFSAMAQAAYFSAVAELPSPCLKAYDQSTPILLANGLQVRNLVATRTGPGFAPPALNTGAAVNSFFDIYVEVSTDGGGSWSNGLDNDCDSFFDIFTEVTVDGGAGGAQSWRGLSATIPVPGLSMPIQIRESPTEPSRGTFSVTPTPGGYMIDSFFDVFVELSVDSGISWETHEIRLIGLPEPATLSLLALGGLALMRRRR